MPAGPASADEIIVFVKAELFSQTPTDPDERTAATKARVELSRKLQIKLREFTGSGRSSGKITRAGCELRMSYSGDPQALADWIEFGTIDSVDAAARRIELTLTD